MEESEESKYPSENFTSGVVSGLLLLVALFDYVVFDVTASVYPLFPFGVGVLSLPVYWAILFLFCKAVYAIGAAASKPMRKALLGCVALGLVSGCVIHWYSTRIDWSSRGLDPNRPGFKPQVVILAGTFDFKSTRGAGSRSGLFEIRMRGREYYYRKVWRGSDWRVGSFFDVMIQTPESWFRLDLRRLPHTTRGGGSGGVFDDATIMLARRLWSTTGFVGANQAELVAEDRLGQIEEFKGLIQVGPWQIPRKIRLSRGTERVENFVIHKVEFSALPKAEWFQQILAKYRDQDLNYATIEEPGVRPGK